ncbi:DUF1269 domain-containing protein [Solirubrobacter phytolaccae]|uniref:DUF1269 domain-containing protein n=1 Tax=Solirubrobacter phytolaccae TaxID=1404360 RepID=A0A9X3NAB1_9ACTN|nr:DUF1269 domain-containing protein [Solirubrobacter phytolaccae]MDA0181359.1 DUF1269 domain-containing protein [Solirubrobacter phytolaccae]
MNTLTVWAFPGPEDAALALGELRELVEDGQVSVTDAALVAWPRGRRTPATRELGAISAPGQMWGGFWGMLLGLVFLTPLAGPAFGAAAGAVAGTLEDFGVADDFVKRIRDHVTPGTSAIFVLTGRASADEVAVRLAGPEVVMLRSELSPEQAEHLRKALADG